jgi:uncharacterized membrane protein affecting hemolysin expression
MPSDCRRHGDGAVRISYDLSALDGEVNRNVMASAGIQLLLLLIGLIVMSYIIVNTSPTRWPSSTSTLLMAWRKSVTTPWC